MPDELTVKVTFHVFSGLILLSLTSSFTSHRSAGLRTEMKSERERNTKLLHKVASTSSSSTSLCLTMRLNTNVMQRPQSPLACSLSLVRIKKFFFNHSLFLHTRINVFGYLILLFNVRCNCSVLQS